jgi:hypothetical protein
MTNSAEPDLEAFIWSAMTAHKVTTDEPLEFIETIKAGAMAYAAGDSDALTETRRLVLHEATRPERTVHPGLRREGPASELNPSGSDRRVEVPEGATLSTGCVVPAPGQGPVKLRPQAVDK